MPDNLPRFAALGLLALGAGACFKVPPNSASLSAMEATEVTASELQMRVYETGRRISTIIENTADTIIAYSSDPAAHRRALRWKLLATPLVEEASLRADPVVAGVDLWVFTMQLSDYLRRGNGRDAFGDLQPIALAAADTMEHLVAQLAARVRPDGKVSVADEQALRTWAERHPLQGSHMGRESILSSDWKTLSLTESSLTGTVASVQRSLTGVTNRLGYLNEGMFKRVLWQSELVARDVVPPLLAEGRAALLHDLSEQGGKLFGAVTEQRVATLATLTEERQAVLDAVRRERIALLDAMRAERATVLEAVRDERIATLATADSIVQRSIDHASAVAGRLVLWIFLALLVLDIVHGIRTARPGGHR